MSKVPPSTLTTTAVDFDGTLCTQLWTPDNPTREIGAPIEENIAKLRALIERGQEPFIYTSRSWGDYAHIDAWLRQHQIPISRIVCEKKLAHAYIDDRAVNASEEVWG